MWEGHQYNEPVTFPALSRYPFIHVGQEEQVRVKCFAQGHNTQAYMGFELTNLSPKLYGWAMRASSLYRTSVTVFWNICKV